MPWVTNADGGLEWQGPVDSEGQPIGPMDRNASGSPIALTRPSGGETIQVDASGQPVLTEQQKAYLSQLAGAPYMSPAFIAYYYRPENIGHDMGGDFVSHFVDSGAFGKLLLAGAGGLTGGFGLGNLTGGLADSLGISPGTLDTILKAGGGALSNPKNPILGAVTGGVKSLIPSVSGLFGGDDVSRETLPPLTSAQDSFTAPERVAGYSDTADAPNAPISGITPGLGLQYTGSYGADEQGNYGGGGNMDWLTELQNLIDSSGSSGFSTDPSFSDLTGGTLDTYAPDNFDLMGNTADLGGDNFDLMGNAGGALATLKKAGIDPASAAGKSLLQRLTQSAGGTGSAGMGALSTLGIAGLLAGLMGGNLGGSTTTQKQTGAVSPELQQLINLNTQLTQAQLNNVNAMSPLQQKQLQLSIDQMNQQGAQTTATNAAISPTDIAGQQRQQFDSAGNLINVGNRATQVQSDLLANGGKATPEQLARIQAAADAAIASGTGDIDIQTRRGIDMISDQVANSRGLRLTDSPIRSEAGLLERAAGDQKSSLINSVRANQANQALSYPLAVNQSQNTIASGQQSTAQAAQAFQEQLRQLATQNRLALTGQTNTAGIGLAGIGGSPVATNVLGATNLANNTTNENKTGGTAGIGQLLAGSGTIASGIGDLLKQAA